MPLTEVSRGGRLWLALGCASVLFWGSPAGEAESQTPRNGEIYVINDCSAQIRFFIRRAVGSRRWINDGWWTFEPREKARLADGGVRVHHYTDHALYFYGYEVERPTRKWSGDHRTDFEGTEYGMMKLTTGRDSAGTTVRLTCD